MIKYTPKELEEAREHPLVKKWRASGRHGTLIERPTVQEIKDRGRYSMVCNEYIVRMTKLIIEEERRRQGEYFRCMFPAYYQNRYDLTAVECEIVRGAIKEKL